MPPVTEVRDAASDAEGGAVLAPWTPGAVERWQPAPFAVDPWTVLRLARYRQRDAVPPAIWEAARAMAARAAELGEPRALLRPVRVAAAGPEGARLADGTGFSGRGVGRLLEGCPLAMACVLTLGPRLEAETSALAERRELLEAFLLDTAGWGAIEHAIRALRLELTRRGRPRGWRVTHRLAPGYQDWPLAQQRGLVGLFGDAAGLVRLSEHGVLVPFKSVTGLFGLAPARRG